VESAAVGVIGHHVAHILWKSEGFRERSGVSRKDVHTGGSSR